MTAGRDAPRIGVFGRSGSGKSSYVKAALRAAPRVVVFDPLEEYAALPGFRAVASADDVLRAAERSYVSFRLALTPRAGREAEDLDRLARAARIVQAPAKAGGGRRLVVVVEEMNLSFPVAGGAERAPAFADLCSRGRHWDVELWGVSQRIAEVSTRFRGNLSRVVVFAQSGPRDLRAACDALGFVEVEQVRALAPHAYLTAEPGAAPTVGRNRLRAGRA